jgi:hypothetical protein
VSVEEPAVKGVGEQLCARLSSDDPPPVSDQLLAQGLVGDLFDEGFNNELVERFGRELAFFEVAVVVKMPFAIEPPETEDA